MTTRLSPRRFIQYGRIALIAALAAYVVAVVVYVVWIDRRSLVVSSILAGVGLLLFAATLACGSYLDRGEDWQMEQRIKAEFPPEAQSEAADIYYALKMKGLGYLFARVLDGAQGDVRRARDLAALARSIGAEAFLEKHW